MKDNETKCLLCGGTSELKYKDYPGYQEPDTFNIYHCRDCNTAFSLPRVDTGSLYEYIYKNGDKVPGYNRYWKYARIVKKLQNPLSYLADTKDVYWGVKKALSLYVKDKKSAKILEIGSGLGYLTYSLIKADYDAVGLDISQTAVKQANETFGEHYIAADLFEYCKLYPGAFDIVILTEVIEHIDRPGDFIEAIIHLLKPGGRAIITTPNKSLYPAGVTWATDLAPVHCWWFSEESMMYIAKKLKVDISFLDFSDYYAKNYQVVNIGSLRNARLPNPYFNKNGELIRQAAQSKNALKSSIQLFINKFEVAKTISDKITGFAKKSFGKSRKLFNPDLVTCQERGNILCAIMQRS
jgi:SAM-dependent methyltransferase